MARRVRVLLVAATTLVGLIVVVAPAKANPLSATFEVQDWHCAVGESTAGSSR